MWLEIYNFRIKELLIFFLVLFAVCFIATNISYAEKKSPGENTKNELNNTPVNQQGLKVYIDPDTGELISQPEEETPAAVQPNNSVLGGVDEGVIEQPEEIVHPDGSVTVIMPESMQHSTSITIDEDGNKTTECRRNHEHNHE